MAEAEKKDELGLESSAFEALERDFQEVRRLLPVPAKPPLRSAAYQGEGALVRVLWRGRRMFEDDSCTIRIFI